MDITALLLIIGIISGQIIKIPISLGGITLLDIAVFLLTVFGLLRIKFKLKKPNILIKLILVFITICLFSLIFTPLKLKLLEYLTSISYTSRLFFYFLLGYVIYSGGLTKLKKNILKILIYSGVGLSILGIIQLIIFPNLGFLSSEGWDPHYFRIVSTFLDPNFLGAFLVLTLLLIYQETRNIFQTNFQKGLFFIVYLSLLGTFSRGAYLMFGVSFLTLALLHKSFKLVFLTVMLSILLIISFLIYSNIVASPRNIDRNQSAQYRVSSWSQGIGIFSKNPLLGVGFNSYRYALKTYHLASDQFLQSRGASTNDSSLLYVASTTGIVGLTSFLCLLTSLFLYGFKLITSKNRKGILLISSLTGLLVHSLFADSLFYPFVLIWIILLLNF